MVKNLLIMLPVEFDEVIIYNSDFSKMAMCGVKKAIKVFTRHKTDVIEFKADFITKTATIVLSDKTYIRIINELDVIV